MPKPRDSQRSRLYAAERVIFRFGKSLPEIEDIEKFVRKTLARKAVLARYPELNPDVKVKDGRGQRNALAYGSRAISMPIWSRNEAIVLHELAHTIVNRHWRFHEVASHGWQFASVLLDLVHLVLGKEASTALKASFKANKVRYTKPRTVTLTEEQREVLRARLAAMREAK